MRVSIQVRIDTEPSDAQYGSYGQISFGEDAQLTSADFSTVTEVFSRCHDLLAAIKADQQIRKRETKL